MTGRAYSECGRYGQSVALQYVGEEGKSRKHHRTKAPQQVEQNKVKTDFGARCEMSVTLGGNNLVPLSQHCIS
jgi:hypothetical protein